MEKVETFYERIPDRDALKRPDFVDFFVYHIVDEEKRSAASVGEIVRCFEHCRLPVYSRISAYLSENTTGKKPRFVKGKGGGYLLARDRHDEIKAILSGGHRRVQASADLRKLLAKVQDGNRKDFLTELIDCYEFGANRASIVMCWILAMDCLFDRILTSKLAAFNAEVAKAKGLKVSVVKTREDLSDIKEDRFIELCRASGVIGNDVRKILTEKLGTRNTAAHPSNVKLVSSTTLEFVENMLTNVIIPYFTP